MSIFEPRGPFLFYTDEVEKSKDEAQQEEEKIQEQLCELMYMQQQYHGIIKEQRYALRDSKLRCQYGTRYARLDCIEDNGILKHRFPVFTICDCTTENIHGFGSCLCPEANYRGRLPMTVASSSREGIAVRADCNVFPHICVPLIGGEEQWKQIDGDLLVETNAQGYVPMLMDNAVLVCQYGGIISICDVSDVEEEEEISITQKKYVVLVHKLNIREKADENSKSLKTCEPAERINIMFSTDSKSESRLEELDSNGDIWAKVDLGEGETGWVAARYIIPDEPVVTTFPNVVICKKTENGEITETTYNPTIQWGQAGHGDYNGKPLQDDDDRYIVAVGVRIFRKEYPDNGPILDNEFEAFSGKIDVYVKDRDTGEELKDPIKCIRREMDMKAHTYNHYPYEGKEPEHKNLQVKMLLENGELMESGIWQTGIRYPDVSGSEWESKTTGSCIIEFCSDNTKGINCSKYELVKVVAYLKDDPINTIEG